jgi:glutaminyl-tRNA synthetase
MDDKKPMPEATANEEVRDFIRDLVQADLARGQVQGIVTRFPPEPNGYLHLGHAKSICLNFGLATEYGGRCHLRFDDTNPVKEEQEYIDAIKRDVHWLGFDWGVHLYHASDYFQTLYDWAEHLIRAGLAYVDDTPPDEMRAMRGTLTEPGRASADRDRSVETNLSLFRDMRAGKFPNGACVLRAKIDLASGNMNLRDPVCIASCTRLTRAPAPTGAYTRPTISRMASPTPLNMSRTRSARWSSRTIVPSTTGSSTTCRSRRAHARPNLPASISATPSFPSAT